MPVLSRAPGMLDLTFTRGLLPNGLRVVIHPDRTQPVIAACVAYHVGSAREEPRRSGFAHLFEHMLFQGSQHVPGNDHFRLVTAAGGTLNGTTSADRTLYFETVPSNQLELVLWLESDRMGFLLPALSQRTLDNQRDVVKNERRQSYDDRPYGRVDEALFAALYPPEHPYHRIPIGSMEDIDAASLADVHGFFRRWYGPNNATLVLGGDVEPEAALAQVERYFGPIARGPAVVPMPQSASGLAESVRTVLEDVVTSPQLDLAWPGVPRYSADEAALDMLAMVLSENKASVLDRRLTVDALLARIVSAGNRAMELAGMFTITARAAPGVGLEQLEAEIDAALADLGRRGVDPAQLQRMQNRAAARHHERMELVAHRVNAMALHDLFARDPGLVARELELRLAVTPQDVERVLAAYLLDRPRVCVATIPGGRRAEYGVSHLPPLSDAMKSGPSNAPDVGERRKVTDAVFRATAPLPGPRPVFRTPPIWHAAWAGAGFDVLGSRRRRVPMTTLLLALPGGRVHETKASLGVASLTAELLNEGTRALSTTELTDAIDRLGASLEIGSDDDEITLRLTALDEHLEAAVELLGDVLLEPRFAPQDFERLRAQRLAAIAARADDARRLAHDAWQRLMYGGASVLGQPALGTRATVSGLSAADVERAWVAARARPGARLSLVGDLDAERARSLFAEIDARWGSAPAPTALAEPLAVTPQGRLYLVDVPGAAQSELRVGHMSIASRHPDFFPLGVLNYVLGGAFSSRINLNLREDKGYTYGARSSFRGGLRAGPFSVSSAVHTAHTADAVREILRELAGILDGPTETELAFARDALSQQLVTQLESARALLGVLDTIGKLGWPDDYLEQRLATLARLTRDDLAHLARAHVRPHEACVLVVGDVSAAGLEALGLGPLCVLEPTT